MSQRTAAPKSTRRRRRRDAHQILKRKIAADCAEPAILPERILWCNDNGTAKQWLLQKNLPWWFFGSFLNYCARVCNRALQTHKPRPKFTVAQRRLLACLRQYPMSGEELIEVMKIHLGGGATWVMLDTGLVDLDALSESELLLVSAERRLTIHRERYKPRDYLIPRPGKGIPYDLLYQAARESPAYN
jgi:hypothetical protein